MAKDKSWSFHQIITNIWFWLGIGLVLRLFLVYFQYSGDVQNHIVWGNSAREQLSGFYSRTFPGFNAPNYPPLTIMFFAISSWLYHSIASLFVFFNQSFSFFPSSLVPLSQTLNFQAAIFKLPGIIADLGVAYLIYRISPKTKKSFSAQLITILYIFNPAVVYISTVWGQIESLPIFFILLSLYFLFIKARFYFSHFSFLLAVLSKQTALWLFPVFVIVWFKQKRAIQTIKGLILQLFLFIVFYFPFTGPITSISSYIATLAGSSTYVSDSAWNLWHFLLGQGVSDTYLFAGISVRIVSILLLLFAYLGVLIWLFRSYSFSTTIWALFLISFFAFFFQTRVHERHLAPVMAFALLLSLRSRYLFLFLFIILTSYHFANLYWTLRLPFV